MINAAQARELPNSAELIDAATAKTPQRDRPRTVVDGGLAEATGQVQIGVPRDYDATFEPHIVKKRQHRLTGVEEIVLPP